MSAFEYVRSKVKEKEKKRKKIIKKLMEMNKNSCKDMNMLEVNSV